MAESKHPWRWRLLRAGTLWLDGGGMFGVVPRPLWERMTPPDARNRIQLQTNCLLLEDGARRVLVETGCSAKWGDKERDLYGLEGRTVVDALRELDVDPATVTDVVLTHLHFDHAGGLTEWDSSGEARSVFKQARIHVQAREWEDATANRAVMTRTYLANHLKPVAEQITLHRGEAEALPGLWVEPGPGHTWGQQMVRFADEGGWCCFPGDVMPTVHHAGLAFSMGYDVEPFTNMQTKGALLQRAAGEGWRIILDHEPGEAVVRVEEDGERPGQYSLKPVGERTPE